MKNIFFLIAISLLFACQKEKEEFFEAQTAYFEGEVFNNQWKIQSGEYGWEGTYSLGGVYTGNQSFPELRNYRAGLTKVPYLRPPDGEYVDTVFSISATGKYNKDSEFAEARSAFSSGVKTMGITKYNVRLLCAFRDSTRSFIYSTEYGNQQGSYFEVIENKQISPIRGENKGLQIKARFSCKLYDKQGNYKGEIKNAEMLTHYFSYQ